MKLTTLMLFVALFQIQANTYSQKTKITLDLKDVAIGEVLNQIESLTEFKFFVNTKQVDLNRIVTINEKKMKVSGILEKIFLGTNVSFVVFDKQIILKPKLIEAIKAMPVVKEELKVFTQSSISGTVISETDGKPLPGVTIILVEDPSKGVLTDFDGKYSIEALEGQSLKFSFMGMETKTIVVGSSSVVDVIMKENSSQLDEVVITALGIKKENRELGYSIQTVAGDDVAERQEINVFDALKGRLAGVEIRQSDGGPGGTTSIVIRGGTNLMVGRSDQPMIVLDGVPIQNDDTNIGGNSGRDWGSGINAINPDDIESMQVLKGPNAAALYGSRAANGVILITTKKGKSHGGVGVTYSYTTRFDETYKYRDVQNEFGIGYNGWDKSEDRFPTNADGNKVPPSVSYWGSGASWGPKMDGTMLEWYDGEMRPYDPQPNNIKEPWEVGRQDIHSVSFSGANDKGSFRASVADLKATSIQPNSHFNRLNVSLNSAFQLSEKVNAALVMNYSKIDQLNPLQTGDADNAFGKALLYNWARSERVGLRLDGYKNEDGTRGFNQGRSGNGVWNMLETFDNRETDRYIGSFTLNWEIFDWMSVMLRSGIDNQYIKYDYRRTPHDLDGLQGQYRPGLRRNNIANHEYLLMFNKDITEDLVFSGTFGGSIFNEKRYALNARTYSGFSNPGLYAIDNNDGDNLNPNESFYEKEVRAIYGTVDFSYKNYLFLQLTGRNDTSSTLPQDSNSYFYPSVSSSFVFSDVFSLPEWFSSGKVRASWAKASTDDSPYQLLPTYGIGNWFGLPTASVNAQIPPTNLKPQSTVAIETGFDVGFLNDKLFVTFNYYNNTSEDQVLSGPVASSSGFTSKRFNTGSITNSGVELTINAFPVVTDNFKWEVVFNYAKNSNKINSLDDDGGVTVFNLGGIWGSNGPAIQAIKGESYGSIRGWDFIYDDATGKKLIDSDGYPYTTNQRVTLGNITPDWLGGLINTFTYKSFTFNVIMDAKIGGDMWFGTKAVGDGFGQSIESLYARDASHGGLVWTDSNSNSRDDGAIIDGIVSDTPIYNDETGSYDYNTSGENTKIISSYDYHASQASGWGAGAPTTNAVFENSYVRLTELSLAYNVPMKWISKIHLQNLTLGVYGRNLAFLYKTAPDNINPLGGINPGKVGGIEFGSTPMTRQIGFNVKVSF